MRNVKCRSKALLPSISERFEVNWLSRNMSFILDSRQSLLVNNKPGFTTVRQDFAFPVLKHGAIIQCMHDLGINCTEENLLHPEKNIELCRLMYEQLAELCTGVTREEMNQPAFSGLNALNYPELHEESVPKLNAYRACCKMMELCGVQDFTIKDFIAPTAKRLQASRCWNQKSQH